MQKLDILIDLHLVQKVVGLQLRVLATVKAEISSYVFHVENASQMTDHLHAIG